MSTRDTAGKIYQQMKSKIQDSVNPFEYIEGMGKDWMKDVVEMVERDSRKTDKDFFVEVCMWIDQGVLIGTPQWRAISRFTCPTPFYDRGVFHYIRKEERLEFLWFVPGPKECAYYIQNALNLDDSEKEAARTVLDFKDGTLLRIAKKLNGETEDDELIFYRKDEDGRPITN